MKDLKICLVSDTVYDINGVSRFIQDFSKEAIKSNKKFSVITSTSKKHYENIENIYNIKPIFKMKMPFYKSLDLVFPSFFKIKNKIKELNPDLLHISTPGTVGICALISAKCLKIPIIGIYHTDFPSYIYQNTKSSFAKWGTEKFLKLFYSSYKFLFSRSTEYLFSIEKQLGFSQNNLYLLKAGISIDNFDRKFKDDNIWENYDVDKNKFKCLYTGRISVEKNVDKLIEFWRKEGFSNCELILVGDMEISSLNLKELKKFNITFLGRKQELILSKIYASSDCFIFPSTTDTLGQVVMEALSSGLPVIVSNKGGPKSFVNEEFGFIVDMDSFDTVANIVKKLSLKDELYYLKKEAAYNFMRDKSISHSFSHFWENNLRIYRKIKNV